MCLIVFFVQDIIYLISVGLVGDILGIELTGDFQFQYLLGSFSGSSVSGMLFGFIAASLITSDYKSRDIQCAIAQGHSRAHIMFSKIIVYIVAIWILSLEDILVYTIGGCICGGFGKAFTLNVAGYMLRSIACEGFVLTMLYMTCVFLAFALTYPDMQVMLYFIIPIKMKWMGALYGVMIFVSRRADHARTVPVGCSGENTGLYAVQLCEGDEPGRYRLESRGNIPGSGRCVWRGDDSGNVVDIQEERSSIENYDRIYICSTVHLC